MPGEFYKNKTSIDTEIKVKLQTPFKVEPIEILFCVMGPHIDEATTDRLVDALNNNFGND